MISLPSCINITHLTGFFISQKWPGGTTTNGKGPLTRTWLSCKIIDLGPTSRLVTFELWNKKCEHNQMAMSKFFACKFKKPEKGCHVINTYMCSSLPDLGHGHIVMAWYVQLCSLSVIKRLTTMQGFSKLSHSVVGIELNMGNFHCFTLNNALICHRSTITSLTKLK